jgi:hypothetical protein
VPLPKKAVPQPAPAPARKTTRKTGEVLADARRARKAAKAAPAPEPRPSAAKTRAGQMPPLDPTGTSDLAIAMRELLVGGETRQEVMHRVTQLLQGSQTRGGKPKPVSTIINHALNRALAHGYKVEASWRLVQDPKYKRPSDEIVVEVNETKRGIEVVVTTPSHDDTPETVTVKKLPRLKR